VVVTGGSRCAELTLSDGVVQQDDTVEVCVQLLVDEMPAEVVVRPSK
jgi:hypothetical protein